MKRGPFGTFAVSLRSSLIEVWIYMGWPEITIVAGFVAKLIPIQFVRQANV